MGQLFILLTLSLVTLPFAHAQYDEVYYINTQGYFDYDLGKSVAVIEKLDFALLEYGTIPSSLVWVVDDWVINIESWYQNGAISETEYNNALKYLVHSGIAKAKYI